MSKRETGAPKTEPTAKADAYRATVRTLCRDGTINTRDAFGPDCESAYHNAEAQNGDFCILHGGVQKHTRVSCKAE